MSDFLNGPGFFGTNASFKVDATLALILATALMFTVGWRLAVHKRFKAHQRVQTTAVIINSVVVLSTMIGSFATHILPGIPEKFGEGDYALTTLHAFVGSVAMLLGIFVVLRGHKLVPKAMRFKNYRRVMRASYSLYMIATILGVIVYITVYILGI